MEEKRFQISPMERALVQLGHRVNRKHDFSLSRKLTCWASSTAESENLVRLNNKYFHGRQGVRGLRVSAENRGRLGKP